MEIRPGIHLVDKGYSNVYLLVRKNKIILIDTGMDKNATKILDYIKKLKHKPEDISYILLTHSHLDHIRGLAKIKKLSNAKIAVHKSEAKMVSGKAPLLFPKGFLGILFRILFPFMGHKPATPDILLKNNDRIVGLKVIHLPGHTPGSICFYMPNKKIIFSGDLIFHKNGTFIYPETKYNVNERLLKASVKKFSKLNFDYMLAGHGNILGPKASKLLRNFLKK